jgi:hypothetical protein
LVSLSFLPVSFHRCFNFVQTAFVKECAVYPPFNKYIWTKKHSFSKKAQNLQKPFQKKKCVLVKAKYNGLLSYFLLQIYIIFSFFYFFNTNQKSKRLEEKWRIKKDLCNCRRYQCPLHQDVL